MGEEIEKWICNCGYQNDKIFDQCLLCNEKRPMDVQFVSPSKPSFANWSVQPSPSEPTSLTSPLDTEDQQSQSGSPFPGFSSKQDSPAKDEKRKWFDILTSEKEGPDPRWNFTKENPLKIFEDLEKEYQPMLPEEMTQLITTFSSGTEDQVNVLKSYYRHHYSSQDLQTFNRFILNSINLKIKEPFRLCAAIYCLALSQKISILEDKPDLSGLTTLINIRKPPELVNTVVYGLGIIGHPSALPYLFDILKNGVRINLFAGTDMTTEEFSVYSLICRKTALISLALIDNEEVIKSLIMSVEMDGTDFEDLESNASLGMIGLIKMGVETSQWQKKRICSSTLLVDPMALSFSLAVAMKGDVARFWFFHQIINILKVLSSKFGTQMFIDCLGSTKTTLQRLMVALALLGFPEIPYEKILFEGKLSVDHNERLLSYYGIAKLAVETKQEIYIKGVEDGLKDFDRIPRLAIAACVLLNNIEPLIPQVLKMIESQKIEDRIALVSPLSTLAIQKNQMAEQKLKEMVQKEQDKILRDNIMEFLIDLPSLQLRFTESLKEPKEEVELNQSLEQRPTWTGIN
jgi:hypothetical protein